MKIRLTTYLALALLTLIVRFLIEQPQARSASSGPTSLPTEIPLTTEHSSPSPQINPFQDASDKAVGAAAISQSAQSEYDWDAVAELLQEAITLTKTIPKSSSNYALAQKKLVEYQRNFAYARQQAIKFAPHPDLTATRTTHTISGGQAVAQQRSSRNTASIDPAAQEQLVSIVVPKTAVPISSTSNTGVPQLRRAVKIVVGQFFALDARLDVGMQYGEYSDRVAEMKAALNRLSNRPGITNLAAYTSLRRALTDYETALNTWNCVKIHNGSLKAATLTEISLEMLPEMPEVFSSKTAFFQGQFVHTAGGDSNWKEKSYLRTTISATWVAAREHMEAAQHQL